MDNRRKHSKRVFAMLLVLIMCLSQAVTTAADEAVTAAVTEESAQTEPEAALKETEEAAEAVPEKTASGEASPEEPEEAASGEAIPSAAELEEAAGNGEYPVSGNFKYVLSDNGTEVIITGHKDPKETATGSIDIPATINGLPVTVISDNAFKGYENITSLSLGSIIKTIGEEAFSGCFGLSGNLTIPDSVTSVGEDVFKKSHFTTISNNSSCSMPASYFWNNDTVCFVNDSGTEFREGDNIPNGRCVRKIETPKSVSLNRTEMTVSVGTRQKLTATISPDNVYDKSITWSSSDERVARVDNEGNVRGIKNGTATITATPKHGSKTAACKVTVKTGVYDDKLFYVLSDNEAEVIITGHKGGTEASGSLVIPASINVEDHNYPVTAISDFAFSRCNKLTGPLKIPDSVTSIGMCAFNDCTGFRGTLTIPDSVTTIGKGAFQGCQGFTGNLTIPNSVVTISNDAFLGCQGFTGSLTIPNSVTAIGNSAFDKCYDICRIENKSSQRLPVNWFWDVNDATTKCFKDANGNKITNRESGEFSKGVYERKIDTPPTGVSLNKTSLEITLGAAPETLIATVSPSNTYWDEVSWNSSDQTVATVSNGVVTGIKPGNTVVTVTTVSGPFSASCNVTVKRIPVTGVTLNKSAISMYPAETEDLAATVAPSDASNKSVRWFTSNEKVATVDNGKVTSISPGSATITVSTNDGGFTATCAVRVFTKTTAHKVTFLTDDGKPYDTQTVENGKQATDPGSPSKSGYIFIGWSDGTSIWNFTTPVNKDLILTAKYKAEQVVVSENTGSGIDPTPVVSEPEKKGEKTAYKLYLVKGQTFAAGGKGWTTTDKTIANVAANTGKITAKKAGTATVANDTTEYTVYIAAPAVSKNSKSVTVLVGQSAEVGIDLQAVDGTENKYPVTWYSANPKVAVVNGGMVTGVAKGSAKVTAYIGGKAYSATVKVIDTCKAPAKIKENKASFSMNPLQTFSVKFDSSVFTVKNAKWSGDGMAKVKNKSGKLTGYENKVIRITTSGKFTAIGPGTTTVTGTDSTSRTVTVTVNVVPVSTKGMAYITKGKKDTIKFPKVTNNKADWWKSSNEKAATVDTVKKNGKVTGIDYGRSDISCLYKGFTFSTPVYVEDPGMTFGGKEVKNKDKIEMKVGEMKQLKINKTYQTLNFKSSKQASAFVDENGFVYARKKGKATISTKINGTAYKITVDVKE